MAKKSKKTIEYTPEQQAVIDYMATPHDSKQICVINAFAGSGKTSVIEGAVKELRKNNPFASILYLVFNAERAEEARKKLKTHGVDTRTVHSYALEKFKKQKGGIFVANCIKPIEDLINSFRNDEIDKLKKGIKSEDERFFSLESNHPILKIWEDYEKSPILNLDDYCRSISDQGILSIVAGYNATQNTINVFKYLYTVAVRRKVYTHGMYLKHYALEYNDINHYDYVLIDEAQDLNLHMATILERLDYNNLYLVGDIYQQIYEFMGTVNIMEKYLNRCTHTFTLGTSFRLNHITAEVCNEILSFINNRIHITAGHTAVTLPPSYSCITLFRYRASMTCFAIEQLLNNGNLIVKFVGQDYSTFDKVMSKETLSLLCALLDDDGQSQIADEIRTEFKVSKFLRSTIKSLVKQARNHRLTLNQYMKAYYSSIDINFAKVGTFYRKVVGILGFKAIPEGLRRLKHSMSKKKTEDSDFLLLGTVHSSKGQQWDKVILGPDNWDFDKLEELYIVYVACSRAIYELDYTNLKTTLLCYKRYYRDLGWRPSKYGTIDQLLNKDNVPDTEWVSAREQQYLDDIDDINVLEDLELSVV